MGQIFQKEIEYKKIPKQHILIPFLYSGREGGISTLFPYGTSAIDSILSIPPFNKVAPLFNELKQKIFSYREASLLDLLQLPVEPNQLIQSYRVDQILLNPWISVDTFKKVEGFLEKHKEEEDDQIVKKFVRYLYKNLEREFVRDYLLNWGFLLYYFNYSPLNPEYKSLHNWPIYHDNPESIRLKEFIAEKIKEILSYYHLDYHVFTAENCFRILPKGIYLYRAFNRERHLYGNLESGIWAGINVKDIISYLLPEYENIEEDEKMNNTLFSYCKNVKNVAVFKTTKELRLLDFSNQKTIEYVRELIREKNRELLPIFDEAYYHNHHHLVRYSITENDEKIARFLCEQNIDGYIGFNSKDFHDEVMICDQKNTLQVIEILEKKEFNLPFCDSPYIEHDLVIELS